MNKKIVLVVVAVIALAGTVWFFVSRGGKIQSDMANTQEMQSIQDLLAKGGSQKCEFADGPENARTSGMIYLSNGRMRADFTSNVGGTVTSGHALVIDNKMHTWTEGAKTGIVLSLDTAPNADSENPGFNTSKKADYHCSAWKSDEAVFVPPQTVAFTDVNAIIKSEDDPEGAGQDNCASCDNVPEAYRAQCRATMACK